MDIAIAVAAGWIIGQNNILLIGLITLGVSLAIYGLIFLIFCILIVPFQENIKQEIEKESQNKTISRLVRKFEREKIKTTNVKIIPREDVPHLDNTDQYHYAYLEISNGEDTDLLDCYANLTRLNIDIDGTDEWGDYLDWATGGGTNELIFPKFSANDQKRVRRKNKERIDIAKWKPGSYPVFCLQTARKK